MKHINALLNQKQYSNLLTLLSEARDRATDSILTCQLTEEEIDELEEVVL
jgi:Trp operon repressor